jgi:myosin heavy subunit
VIKKPDVAATRENKALQTAFVVVHYAGDVAYNVEGFLSKNKDTLLNDLDEIGSTSQSEFVRELFAADKQASARSTMVGAMLFFYLIYWVRLCFFLNRSSQNL